MRSAPAAISVAILTLCQGCSHIPDPGDVEGAEPFAILQRIRCEVREAIEQDQPGNTELLKATIGYGLRLKSEENTAQSATPGLKWPLLHGSISLGASANSETERYSEGITNVTEDVEKTLTADCNTLHGPLVGLYPIVGKLGLRKIVNRYVKVNEIGATAPVQGFVQELKFRLKFKAGLKPSYELIPGFNPNTTGLFDFSADRQDTHVLTISMTPYQATKKDKVVQVHIVNLRDIAGRPQAVIPDGGAPFTPAKKKKPKGSQTFSAPGTSGAAEAVQETIRNRQNQQRFEEFIQERIQ